MSPRNKPHGTLRQSQVITTFGPGALLDLPNHSALVGGLDYWSQQGRVEINEPRLLSKLKTLLGVAQLRLFSPPPELDDPLVLGTGITAWQFPECFIVQKKDVSETNPTRRSRLLVSRRSLTKSKYIDVDRKAWPVVPVRFVRACRHGHIGDIDWKVFTHSGSTTCTKQLWFDEEGTSGDLSEIRVRCTCGAGRMLLDATDIGTFPLGKCTGDRPWLGAGSRENCDEPNRLLVRTASNAYFPELMGVISLPDRDRDVVKAVDQVWANFLEYVETLEDLKDERRKKPPVRIALEGISDEDAFAEIQTRKGSGPASTGKSVKTAELEVLQDSKEELGGDVIDGDFFARALPRAKWEAPWMKGIERVVLIHRLREVVAQVGFTRFEASAPDVEGELEIGVSRASIALELSWLPAIENRGEGIFIGFEKAAIESWLSITSVKTRGELLLAGFDKWKDEHPRSSREFPGVPYVLLHSLSHLLITAVSLECGYPASSIRERIYSGSNGYGILLFTGSTDAEGTLGGLVETGKQISRHFRTALELAELCSNDPVCAQHEPNNSLARRFLHGAACHGCLLIAETSCEQRNDFLDRSLALPTVDDSGAAFFDLEDFSRLSSLSSST